MSTTRNIVGADVFDQNLEHVALLSNELLPSEYFTSSLAEFCDHAAYHSDIHSISMPIVLLNVAATSTEKSGIWRSNVERFPLNLYSLLVGNSSFGKSKLLRLITHGLQIIGDTFPHKFQSSVIDNKNNCPVYNDATCAGIIASVNGCTRVLISEEADVLLPSIGAVLPSPYINKDVPTVKSEARVEMMKMFDGDCHMRKLKGSISKMDSFKHSFVGASSGGIIVTALQRKSHGSQVDAFFERLLIWCLRPPPLMFVPENEKKKPDTHKFPSFEEFCVILGLFENFELYYDIDSDKVMVDFGNRYTKLAYQQTDRYLMAKIGKMVQLTHRLVGLVQVLEWSWNIAAEYLRINGRFNSSITNEFIQDVREIFKRVHGEDSTDKRTFVVSIAAVERAINISQALLEQYKLIMHVPDDLNRIISQKSDNVQSDVVERSSMNNKLEKSKSKFSEHVRGILLFKSVIFTSTTLYRACSVFRHHSENVNSVLQALVKADLLIAFSNGVVTPTKKAVVYIKWLPGINNPVERQRFEQTLATFNDDRISADSVIASTTVASLEPHKACPQPAVLNYLKNDRYSQLKLNFSMNNLQVENTSDLSVADDDSNSCSISIDGLGKTNEVNLIKFPGDVDKQPSESASVEQSVSINESSVTDGINTILSNSMNNENCIMQENIKNIEDIHARVDNVSPQNTLTDPNQTDQCCNCAFKRKSTENEPYHDDIPHRVRIRTDQDDIEH